MIENKMMLQFKIDNQSVERLDNVKVAKSSNFLYARFTFSDNWEGLTKYAIFNSIDMLNPTEVALDNDSIVKVPDELIEFPGIILTLRGVKDNIEVFTENVMIDVEFMRTALSQE